MAASSARARRRRQPRPPKYTRRAGELRVGHMLRVTVSRQRRRLPSLVIDELVEHVDWERDGAIRRGELNFRRPLDARGADMLLSGDHVELYARPFHGVRWRRVWRMKVATPRHQIAEGLISVALTSALGKNFDGSKVAWKIKAGRRAHRVTREACQRFRVPVGRLPTGRAKLPKRIAKKASVEQIVGWAWRQERHETGRRFDIDASRGVLDVIELRYPRYALVLGDEIIAADLEHSIGKVCSAVIATSTSRKRGSRKSKKLRVKIVDRGRLKRYGYIVRHVEKHGHSTRAELRRWARKFLARERQPTHDLVFTHPGIPWLDRGDAVRVVLSEDRLTVDGWVKAVRHTASGGSYEMEVTVGMSDPYRDRKAEKTRRKRAAAARRRHRAGAAKPTPPKAKKASRRS